jgi:hypothetical protein
VLRPYESVDEALADSYPAAVDLTLRMHDAAAQLDALHEGMTRFLESLNRPPSDKWRMLFELAVSEIAANIIEHARPRRSTSTSASRPEPSSPSSRTPAAAGRARPAPPTSSISSWSEVAA